jgi:hypothetical protein
VDDAARPAGPERRRDRLADPVRIRQPPPGELTQRPPGSPGRARRYRHRRRLLPARRTEGAVLARGVPPLGGDASSPSPDRWTARLATVAWPDTGCASAPGTTKAGIGIPSRTGAPGFGAGTTRLPAVYRRRTPLSRAATSGGRDPSHRAVATHRPSTRSVDRVDHPQQRCGEAHGLVRPHELRRSRTIWRGQLACHDLYVAAAP